MSIDAKAVFAADKPKIKLCPRCHLLSVEHPTPDDCIRDMRVYIGRQQGPNALRDLADRLARGSVEVAAKLHMAEQEVTRLREALNVMHAAAKRLARHTMHMDACDVEVRDGDPRARCTCGKSGAVSDYEKALVHVRELLSALPAREGTEVEHG